MLRTSCMTGRPALSVAAPYSELCMHARPFTSESLRPPVAFNRCRPTCTGLPSGTVFFLCCRCAATPKPAAALPFGASLIRVTGRFSFEVYADLAVRVCSAKHNTDSRPSAKSRALRTLFGEEARYVKQTEYGSHLVPLCCSPSRQACCVAYRRHAACTFRAFDVMRYAATPRQVAHAPEKVTLTTFLHRVALR